MIHPGQPWLDTDGAPIHAHSGSIITVDGIFYWYGENKEHTRPGNGIWQWGVRCYSSTDLVHWTDRGLIIPPVEDDPSSALHPSSQTDRPHILRHPRTGQFVCWLKVIGRDETQRSTVLVADDLLGPYRIVRTHVCPLGMSAGDFDLVPPEDDRPGCILFERVHSELICADLTGRLTGIAGRHTAHLARGAPPLVREAPAHFVRRGTHYLVTSGTTAYFPNPSEIASAPSPHGPWTVLGDPHPDDPSRTSHNSQISSVFRHPAKDDLYIALADRWMPDLPQLVGGRYATGAASAAAQQVMALLFDPDGHRGVRDSPLLPAPEGDAVEHCAALLDPYSLDTSRSTYVWLPFRFDGAVPRLVWRDEWSPAEFD